MTDLKVVPLDRGNLQDIPELMESAAKNIRAGDWGDIEAAAAVFLRTNGEIVVCGWGATTPMHSIGLLTTGAQWLAAHHTERR